MTSDYGLAWAENQYDRQEPPDDRFTEEWGFTDGEGEDDDEERS